MVMTKGPRVKSIMPTIHKSGSGAFFKDNVKMITGRLIKKPAGQTRTLLDSKLMPLQMLNESSAMDLHRDEKSTVALQVIGLEDCTVERRSRLKTGNRSRQKLLGRDSTHNSDSKEVERTQSML